MQVVFSRVRPSAAEGKCSNLKALSMAADCGDILLPIRGDAFLGVGHRHLVAANLLVQPVLNFVFFK
jgi:hypothetical protein